MAPLSPRQRRHLRSLAHPLRAIVQVGKSGVTEGVVEALEQALRDHELVKVRLGRNLEGPVQVAVDALSSAASAEICGVTGHVVVLYRRRAAGVEPHRPRIELPR